MDDLYKQELLEHYHHPHNYGEIVGPHCRVVESNASCGDELTLSIKFSTIDHQQIVSKAKFFGTGCAVSMASTSLLTDYIQGKSIADLQKIDLDFMQRLIGANVSPGRVKCLTLGARALMNLLNQALVKHV